MCKNVVPKNRQNVAPKIFQNATPNIYFGGATIVRANLGDTISAPALLMGCVLKMRGPNFGATKCNVFWATLGKILGPRRLSF